MNLWKRNAVVAAIMIFVCAAAYLNWSYTQDGVSVDVGNGKVLGEAALVGASGTDPLLQSVEEGEVKVNEVATLSEAASAYFATARLNRQEARDSALSMLQDAANDDKADQETIQKANDSIQSMATFTLSEANVENLVMAKGYSQCLAFLSENSVSVVVSNNGTGLTDLDTAKISDIVTQETGLLTSQVKIIETQ